MSRQHKSTCVLSGCRRACTLCGAARQSRCGPTQRTHLCFDLLQPVRGVHFSVHRSGVGEVLPGLLEVVRASANLAKLGVALRNNGSHTERGSQVNCVGVAAYCLLCIDQAARRDVAENAEDVRLDAPSPLLASGIEGLAGTARASAGRSAREYPSASHDCSHRTKTRVPHLGCSVNASFKER